MERRFLPRLSPLIGLRISLLAILLAACSPTASVPSSTVATTATLPLSSPTLENSTQTTTGPTEALAPTALPIATSRGPNLEATDPKTVSMASGGLQLVEFFEFW